MKCGARHVIPFDLEKVKQAYGLVYEIRGSRIVELPANCSSVERNTSFWLHYADTIDEAKTLVCGHILEKTKKDLELAEARLAKMVGGWFFQWLAGRIRGRFYCESDEVVWLREEVAGLRHKIQVASGLKPADNDFFDIDYLDNKVPMTFFPKIGDAVWVVRFLTDIDKAGICVKQDFISDISLIEIDFEGQKLFDVRCGLAQADDIIFFGANFTLDLMGFSTNQASVSCHLSAAKAEAMAQGIAERTATGIAAYMVPGGLDKCLNVQSY